MNLKLPVALLPLALLFLFTDSGAVEEGAIRLDQSLTDLASDIRAVSLAARPGDGDLEVLALLRRRYGVETHVILATAGEGVGAVPVWGTSAAQQRIRTGEARRAARAVGAHLRPLGLPDLGLARSGDEALLQWDRREAIRRLVIAIREVRPHLVFTDHRDQVRRGAAEAAETLVAEAFAAAADPMQYPDAGPVWKLARVFTACEQEEAEITVDTGAVDLTRGISFVSMASRAREAYRVVELPHRPPPPEGPHLRYFRVAAASIEGEVDTLLAGLPLPRPEWLLEKTRTGTRDEILTTLLALGEAGEEARPPVEKTDAAILSALNLTLSIARADRVLIEEQPGAVEFSIQNGGTKTVTVMGVVMDSEAGLGIENPEFTPTELSPGEAVSGRFWVVPSGESVGDRLLTVRGSVVFDGGRPMTLHARGHFEIRPSVSIEVLPWTRLIRPVDHSSLLQVVVTNHSKEAVEGPLTVALRGTDRVELTPPESVRVEAGHSVLVPVQVVLEDEVDLGLFSLHLAFADHYHQDIFRILEADVPLEMLVGVVATETDASFRVLRALRTAPVRLSDVDLETADLDRLDTIIIGERPFIERPVLQRVLPRLVEFVKNGGNLFLSYSRPSDWEGQILLPEFHYGPERVTREDAEFIVTDLDHRLFNVPNKIEIGELDGWVLERGRYFPVDFNEDRYETLIRCADPGQPLQAGLLIAQYGKGLIIQSSLTWRPQWENLNAGAIKFLANLVSLKWNR